MTAKKTAGHAHKHVASRKHKGTGKHHPSASSKLPGGWKVAPVHVAGKHPHHAKARGFALDGLPVCSLEAVAQSLRLAGQPVSGDEVAWLWELAGGRELTISEALAQWCSSSKSSMTSAAAISKVKTSKAMAGAYRDMPLILGVDVPGPHAVLATRDGWWSWGELHDPWPCRIEEAWAVSW